MKLTWILPLYSAALSAALLATVPAQAAAIYDARFSGVTASTQGSTGYSVGATVSGELIYNGNSNTYTLFTVAGASASPPFTSLASLTPDRSSAIYQAQVSAVQQGGTVNSNFSLNLEGLNPFPVAFGDAPGVLGLGSALLGLLDTAAGNPGTPTPSTFGYTLSQSNGTVTARLVANLTSINVTSTNVAVPEPGSLALLGTAAFGLMGVRRRRG